MISMNCRLRSKKYVGDHLLTKRSMKSMLKCGTISRIRLRPCKYITMEVNQKTIRIAAVGDLHVRETDRGKWKEYFTAICREADVLVLAGDLTDTGDEDEAALLVEELKGCNIPMVGVLGNHDYEKGRQKLIKETLAQANIQILDGESVVIHGIGFAGV